MLDLSDPGGPLGILPISAVGGALLLGLAAGAIRRVPPGQAVIQAIRGAVGLATLWIGGAVAVALVNPLAGAINHGRGFYGGFPEDNALLGALLGTIGLETLLVMTAASLLNITIARLTPLRAVALTGHMMFSLAATVVLALHSLALPAWAVVTAGAIAVALAEAFIPWLLGPIARRVTGQPIVIGFWASSVVLLPAALAARWLPARRDADVESARPRFTRSLGWIEALLADVMVGVAVTTGLAYALATLAWGPTSGLPLASAGPLQAVLLGVLVAGAMAAMLAGLQSFVGVFVPAVQVLADRLAPNHLSALDVPVLWVQPAGALPGVLGCLLGALGATALTLALGPYAILPSSIGIYFLGRSTGQAALALGGSPRAALGAGVLAGFVWPLLVALFFPRIDLVAYGVAGFALSSTDAIAVAWLVLLIARILGVG